MRTLKCTDCGREFEMQLTDTEAVALFEATFRVEFTPETAVPVCSECFDRVWEEKAHTIPKLQ